MTWKNTTDGYGWVHKAIHWTMGLLVASQFAIAWIFTNLPHRTMGRREMFGWHVLVGVMIWLFLLLRVVWRVSNPRVAPAKALSRIERVLSKVVHEFFYLSLLLLPITGYLAVTADGDPLPVLGLSVPALFENKPLGEFLETVHVYLAYVLLAAIVLHIAGALWHLLIMKDRVTQRMLKNEPHS